MIPIVHNVHDNTFVVYTGGHLCLTSLIDEFLWLLSIHKKQDFSVPEKSIFSILKFVADFQ